MQVPFSYLDHQFSDIDAYLSDIKSLVLSGDFTLGEELRNFERRFAQLCEAPYAVGVGTGTDALAMSLKVLGVGPGDEVISTSNTFIATIGAITMVGAKPVFVDTEDGYVIDYTLIEEAITPQTKAIMPVHYTGNLSAMPEIMKIAEKYNLIVVEDACQAIAASLDGKPVGSWGQTAGFSLHPLKNLNVWGDGGVIITHNEETAEELYLYRNHGLINRNKVKVFGINCRLDTLQAVIGNRLIEEVSFITDQRIAHARRYDKAFTEMGDNVQVPVRRTGVKHVFHLYMIRVKQRDELLNYLTQNGIEAKIHYPIPVHLQEAANDLGYQKGDFPFTEADAHRILTLPAHQHLTTDQVDYTIDRVQAFYS